MSLKVWSLIMVWSWRIQLYHVIARMQFIWQRIKCFMRGPTHINVSHYFTEILFAEDIVKKVPSVDNMMNLLTKLLLVFKFRHYLDLNMLTDRVVIRLSFIHIHHPPPFTPIHLSTTHEIFHSHSIHSSSTGETGGSNEYTNRAQIEQFFKLEGEKIDINCI